MQTARVTGLWIYPVKSCRGISLTEMSITTRGPLHDRQWMLVDESNHFITLRTVSKLAEIQTSIQGPFLHLYCGSNKILINTTEECETTEDVVVWNNTVKAGIENKTVNEAISDFLSKSVKLVRYQKESFRDLGEAGTDAVKEVMFADQRPILLVNQGSLAELNTRLAAKNAPQSAIERFRPNIIVDGLAAYGEDGIIEAKIGDVTFKNPKPSSRCPIITQEVETGKVVSKETLVTLAEYRKKEGSSKVLFGVNLTPANTGVIRIGDTLTY